MSGRTADNRRYIRSDFQPLQVARDAAAAARNDDDGNSVSDATAKWLSKPSACVVEYPAMEDTEREWRVRVRCCVK